MDRRRFLAQAGGAILVSGVAVPESQVRAAGVPGSRGGQRRNRRPSVLWIMMDDGRADALGCYGRPWAKTPHMDRIAAEGVRFDVAIVQNPVCVPSRKSMKTGHYAHEIGPVAMGKPPEGGIPYVDARRMDRLNREPNLLDAWTAAGMRPINVGKIHGFRRSWDARGDVPAELDVCGRPTTYAKQTFGDAKAVVPVDAVFTKTHHWMIGGISPLKPEQTQTWRMGNRAVQVLGELAGKDEPFFLRVSFHAPHVACRVPKAYFIDPRTIDLPLPTEAELASKPAFERGPLRTYGGAALTSEQIGLARGTYYGMVSLVDAQVGRLIEVLRRAGRLDETIIAINSDQGFQLGEHGLWKKRVFYEQNVRVPLVLRYPKALPAGWVIDEPVEMVDFLPTLMDLSGLEVPAGIRGRSLRPLIEGRVSRWRPACFSEIDHSQSMYQELRGTGRRVMVRTRRWKLVFFMDARVADKDGALYDLKNDPGETRNLYGRPDHATIVERLERVAVDWAQGGDSTAAIERTPAVT